jgi:hypothetical protein
MPFVFYPILVFALLLIVAVLALGNVEPKPNRTFSLRGFLLFVALWAICLSPFPALALKGGEHISWARAWVIPFAWIILAAFYLQTRHFAAMLVHCAGLLFILPLFALDFLAGGENKEGDFTMWLLVATLLGSFAGLLYFSVKKLLGLHKRNQPKQEKPTP